MSASVRGASSTTGLSDPPYRRRSRGVMHLLVGAGFTAARKSRLAAALTPLVAGTSCRFATLRGASRDRRLRAPRIPASSLPGFTVRLPTPFRTTRAIGAALRVIAELHHSEPPAVAERSPGCSRRRERTSGSRCGARGSRCSPTRCTSPSSRASTSLRAASHSVASSTRCDGRPTKGRRRKRRLSRKAPTVSA